MYLGVEVLEYRIQPYKMPYEVTTSVDFLFNLPLDMFEDAIVVVVVRSSGTNPSV